MSCGVGVAETLKYNEFKHIFVEQTGSTLFRVFQCLVLRCQIPPIFFFFGHCSSVFFFCLHSLFHFILTDPVFFALLDTRSSWRWFLLLSCASRRRRSWRCGGSLSWVNSIWSYLWLWWNRRMIRLTGWRFNRRYWSCLCFWIISIELLSNRAGPDRSVLKLPWVLSDDEDVNPITGSVGRIPIEAAISSRISHTSLIVGREYGSGCSKLSK